MTDIDNDAWMEAAKIRFGFDAWSHHARAEAWPIVRGFSLVIDPGVAGWTLERRIPYGDGGYADYFEKAENPGHRVMARVIECKTRANAELLLLETLSFSMAVTLPRLDAMGVHIGDVGFGGYNQPHTSLIFLRNNVLVDIRSIGEEPTDILGLARQIDAQIQSAASMLPQ